MSRAKSVPPAWLVAALVAALAVACDPATSPRGSETDADPSPNVKMQPAPLATQIAAATPSAQAGVLADASGRLLGPDAGAPPPDPIRPDRALSPEALPRDEGSGVALSAEWRWRDVVGPPEAAEIAKEAIDAAHEPLKLVWKLEMSDAGRMRIRFDSDALPLPRGTELRARVDRYGHLLLWPDGTAYRVIAPGALRTLIGERRIDVTPLSTGRVTTKPPGKRLELATRTIEIKSSYGSFVLELATVHEAGDGGELLCRTLVEIGGVGPDRDICEAFELPLAARYEWRNGGGIDFEVTQILRRTDDLSIRDMLVPPPSAQYRAEGLPSSPSGIFVSREALASVRTRDVPVEPTEDAPGEGFVAQNGLHVMLYLLLDGLPVALVPALSDRYVVGPRSGMYTFQWRTFLGDRVGPPTTLPVPGRVEFGVPEEDPPDAGVGR